MKLKHSAFVLSALVVLPFVHGCASFSAMDDNVKEVPKAPDPMLVSLDDSAKRIALAYQKLSDQGSAKATPSSVVVTPALPPAVVAEPSVAAQETTAALPDKVIPGTIIPQSASPITSVSTSLKDGVVPPSVVTPQTATPAISGDASSENGLESTIYLPGWTGTASRTVQVIAYKIGYKVHISGFRRGAEPTVVLGLKEMTAYNALKDIGDQVSKSMNVHVDPKTRIIHLIYK